MRCWIAVLGLFVGSLYLRGDDWELVYPDTYPLPEDLELLSHCSGDYQQYLVGSENGKVLDGFWPPYSQSIEWQVRKLPLDFDITAIAWVDDHWVLGGRNGEIAIQVPIDSGEDPANSRTHSTVIGNWHIGSTGIQNRIYQLVPLKNRIIARTLREWYISKDKGINWTPLYLPFWPVKLFTFQDQYYALEFSGYEDHGIFQYTRAEWRLLRSDDGEEWEDAWTISGGPHGGHRYASGSSRAMILAHNLNSPYTFLGNRRLYIWADIEYHEINPHTSDDFTSITSTTDGINWQDHGSTITTTGLGVHEITPWNPLSVPDGSRYLYPPEHKPGSVVGNVHLFENRLEIYQDNEWKFMLDTNPKHGFSTENIAKWDNIVFITKDKSLAVLKDQTFENFDLPHSQQEYFNVSGLASFDGTVVVHVEYSDANSGYRELLLSTSDFKNWNEIINDEPFNSFPQIDPDGNKMLIMKADDRFWMWDGHLTKLIINSDTSEPIYPNRFAWNDHFDALFYLRNTDDEVIVDHRTESGDLEEFVRFTVETNSRNFTRLRCPDRKRLVAFGDSAEIAVVEPDGTVISEHLRSYFPNDNSRIESVRFINGWYYIIGPVVLRTRDFDTFEQVDSPHNEELVELSEWDGNLVGFLEYGIFKQPLERGMLDSIEQYQGWRQSDWLGWFQIIDEESGNIDHLLLGDCWVQQVNDQQYWLRTSTLGWIWMNKDWSPWFWRMEDGHWYWLDQDSWPPRAWDYEDQAWEEMNP